MSPESPIAGCDQQLETVTTVTELRRAFFAQVGELAIRYDVRFDRVLEHLSSVRTTRSRHFAVAHVHDLIHAIACVDGVDLAWWDLVEQHERALVRACRQWLDSTEAIVLVRRLLADLRREEAGVQSLRSYDGGMSMRRWLGDRLMGRMNRSGVEFHVNHRAEAEISRPSSITLLDGHFIAGNVIWHRMPRPLDDGRPARPRQQA